MSTEPLEFPSYDYVLGEIAMLHIDPAVDTTVVTPGQTLEVDLEVAITKETEDADFELAFNMKWPNWRKDYAFLKCQNYREFNARFTGIPSMWATWSTNLDFTPLRYIPSDKKKEYEESLRTGKPPVYNLFVNPLCLNSKLAIAAIKVEGTPDFRLTYCFSDRTMGFYRSTPIEAPYFAACTLIEGERKGIVITATEIICFEVTIEPKVEFTILWRAPSPAYDAVAAKSENPDEQLTARYPSVYAVMNKYFMLIARHGKQMSVFDLDSQKVTLRLKLATTSIFLNENEISIGTVQGALACFKYTVSAEGAIELQRESKNVIPFANDYTSSRGDKIRILAKEVTAHYRAGHHSVVAFEHTLVCRDSSPGMNIVAVSPDVVEIVNIAFIGDLMITLTRNYQLLITQVGSASPMRSAVLSKNHLAPIRPGTQAMHVDAYTIRVLMFDGSIARFSVGTPEVKKSVL